MPPPKRSFDEDTDGLETISVLFIPFDAAKQHYRRNARNGVEALTGTFDQSGHPLDLQKTAQVAKPGAWLDPSQIAANLNTIVRRECELVRKLHNPDDDDRTVEDFIASQRPGDDPARFASGRRRIETSLRGDKYYPTLIFLSENPTGQPFPDCLDASLQGTGHRYVKKHSLESGLPRVNQMAVYLREDVDRRILQSKGESDALFISTESLTRKPEASLFKPNKNEFFLKMTIGRSAGQSLTVAGVHLRATLTGSGSAYQMAERAALKKFCDANGIQLLIGDFNMDLQEGFERGRGVFYDGSPESLPIFMISPGSDVEPKGVAFPLYQQQFSSSNNQKHYMGYFQADTDTLRIVGQSIYGHMGMSGSRSLSSGYYSDHPSVYVCLESQRISSEAQTKILQRKIVRARRSMMLDPK